MDTTQFLSASNQINLVVLEHGQVCCYSIGSRNRWTLGRSTERNAPDIPLTSPIVSRTHGEFVMIDGQWFYCDLGSRNGTLYNGAKIRRGLNGRVCPVMLENGDVLRIDRSKADGAGTRGVWILFSTESISGRWSYFSFAGKSSMHIGRDRAQCDLVQPLTSVSPMHARIVLREGNYYLSDCGSKLGTWLNGAQVRAPTRLREKDRISICGCHFIFTGDGLVYNDRHTGREKAR